MDTLYSLTDDLRQLIDLAPSIDPEDAQCFLDTLEGVLGARDDKLDGYAAVIDTLKSQVELLDHEEVRIANRKKAVENRIKLMKERMIQSMHATNQTKIQTELHTFSIQKNGGVAPLKISIDVKDIPKEYLKFKPEADNAKIREALEAGTKLDWAAIEERGEQLRIR